MINRQLSAFAGVTHYMIQCTCGRFTALPICILTQPCMVRAQDAKSCDTQPFMPCRYKYLQTGDGSFHNPFSRGCMSNCSEACQPDKTPMAPVYMFKDSAGSPPTQLTTVNCCNAHV
jgi:hypothetical protein